MHLLHSDGREAARPCAPAPVRTSPDLREASLDAAKILIIDDEIFVVELLSRILRRMGCGQIESTTDSDDAVGLFHRFQPDLVILDLNMPGRGGTKVLADLRAAISPDTYLPILVVTGESGEGVRNAALAGGASDFVNKPYDPSEITHRVGNLLEKRFLLHQLAARNQALSAELRNRRDAEEAQKEAKEKAEEANRAKSDFLARMSHELRTPLNAILGFAQLLQMDARDADAADSIAQILKAGRHLVELTGEVLDISRIEANQLALYPEAISVRAALGEAVDLVRPMADAQQITLGDLTGDWQVLGDRRRLKQVLLNLLTNAIKYNCPGGHVTLTAEETASGRLRLSVSDTGTGIAPEDARKLFVPFERLHASGTPTEGSGLGLAISKRLIELMGGQISVASAPGDGSTFSIELPMAESPAEPADASGMASAQEEEAVASQTILYIEDNPSNAMLMGLVIERRPATRLLGAAQGLEGVELARQHHPNLVLLDLNLPDINGDEVLERLQADPRTASIPVVMLSGDALPTQVERLLSLGARNYVTKPFNVRSFLALLDEVLSPQPAPRPIPSLC